MLNFAVYKKALVAMRLSVEKHKINRIYNAAQDELPIRYRLDAQGQILRCALVAVSSGLRQFALCLLDGFAKLNDKLANRILGSVKAFMTCGNEPSASVFIMVNVFKGVPFGQHLLCPVFAGQVSDFAYCCQELLTARTADI